MIVGLSHIAINCADIDGATSRLADFGYELRFDAPRLQNHEEKIPFLSHHQPEHHIRALAAEGAMAIELLDHGEKTDLQAASLIPVFRSENALEDWQARPLDSLPISSEGLDELSAAIGQELCAYYDPVLAMTLLWTPANGEASGLSFCVAPSASPDAVTTLLSQLRFRPNAMGLWSLLTPLPALQARLFPVLSKPAEGWTLEPKLDATGCACLALMARNTGQFALPAELQDSSASFTIQVNGKDSLITLASPDHGPIIELVDQTS